MAESDVERRLGEIWRWRINLRRDTLRDQWIRCLADLEDLHQAGDGGTQAKLPVLPDVGRSRCHALSALHQPARAGLNVAPTPRIGSVRLRRVVERRADLGE